MIKFSDERNMKLITRKVKRQFLRKVHKGIYLEPRDKLSNFAELVIDKLAIKGIISYSSALEFPNNIGDNLYIQGSVNKKYNFSEDNFMIHVLQANKKISYNGDMLEKTRIDGILKLNFDVACLVQFIPSSIFEKRSNKKLACKMIVEKILHNFGGIDQAGEYFKALKRRSLIYGLEEPFEILKEYFQDYYRKYYLTKDTKRVAMFTVLRDELLIKPPIVYPAIKEDTLFFFEAYFTNYIEGTEFEIEEAEKIVYDASHRYERHKDGNDIKQTYEVVKSIVQNPIYYANYQDFESALKKVHYKMMGHRDEIIVGEFKEKVNRSGALRFVLPEQVIPTLKKGFELYQSLVEPFHKAVFMMTFLSEIHPFEDGNGRIARLFMNNELSKGNQLHILVPTVFRDDYITALKGFSHQENPQPIINSLVKAYKITNEIKWESLRGEVTEYIQNNSGFEKDSNSIWGVRPSLSEELKHNEDELPFSLG